MDVRVGQSRDAADFACAPGIEISVSRGSPTLGLTTVRTSVLPWIDPEPFSPQNSAGLPARAFVGRTNTVAPVIAVGQAASGKAHDRRLDLAHVLHEFSANPVDVWNDSLTIERTKSSPLPCHCDIL